MQLASYTRDKLVMHEEKSAGLQENVHYFCSILATSGVEWQCYLSLHTNFN
jgi:hypothetical protein